METQENKELEGILISKLGSRQDKRVFDKTELRVPHPETCGSKGQISKHQSHTVGFLWGSLVSVGKQTEPTDKTKITKILSQSSRVKRTGPVLP